MNPFNPKLPTQQQSMSGIKPAVMPTASDRVMSTTGQSSPYSNPFKPNNPDYSSTEYNPNPRIWGLGTQNYGAFGQSPFNGVRMPNAQLPQVDLSALLGAFQLPNYLPQAPAEEDIGIDNPATQPNPFDPMPPVSGGHGGGYSFGGGGWTGNWAGSNPFLGGANNWGGDNNWLSTFDEYQRQRGIA